MLLKRFQLGLIHVAVAMTLVPINSTLNRVMIKELAISATLVAILASLPYLFAPIQVAIGSYSDRHPIFGLRRTPYILAGLILCVLGLIASPYVAFLMADNLPLGILAGILAFGAWGMGYNLSSVSYLSLASEISGEKGRGKTIATMWFMMIVSIIATAIGLSRMVDPYTPEALIRAFGYIAAAALILGLIGLIRLEPRSSISSSSSVRSIYRQTNDLRHHTKSSCAHFLYLSALVACRDPGTGCFARTLWRRSLRHDRHPNDAHHIHLGYFCFGRNYHRRPARRTRGEKNDRAIWQPRRACRLCCDRSERAYSI